MEKKKDRKKSQTDFSVSGMNWSIPKAGLYFYGLWHFLFLSIPNAISVFGRAFHSSMVKLLWNCAAEEFSYSMEVFQGSLSTLPSYVVWPNWARTETFQNSIAKANILEFTRYSFILLWEIQNKNNDTFWAIHLVDFLQ